MGNLIFVILDGVGIGELNDAGKYGDVGSNTLVNIANHVGGLKLPNLNSLGLGNIASIKGLEPLPEPLGSYGKMEEVSPGKDSTTGHWELAGVKVDIDFSYYPEGFPKELMDSFMEKTGCKGYLGNKPASGTAIIDELGDEHVRTGYPIIYTSGDSVFQIAAHEEVFGLQRLYDVCEITRHQVLGGEHTIGRVIARPFIGTSGNYKRTTNRHDYSLNPPRATVLDLLYAKNINTVAIGKINDLFNHKGITIPLPTKSNGEGVEKIVSSIKEYKNSFIFANLVDFDVYYGHRLDPNGFATALEDFDKVLPRILEAMADDDVLMISADHGNDPTSKSTDHSREHVPIIYYSKKMKGIDLGTRKSFADAGKSIAKFFGIENELFGTEFFS